MSTITIIKGDDTNWNDQQTFVINIKTTLDLSNGFSAQFILGDIVKEFDSIVDNKIYPILNNKETSTLPLGYLNGVLKIFDSEKRIRTVKSNIPFMIRGGVYSSNSDINADGETLPVEEINITVGSADIVDYNSLVHKPSINGFELVGEVTLTDLGLGNIDNTSDLNKPISTATQEALDLKADKTELDSVKQSVVELNNEVEGISTELDNKLDSSVFDAFKADSKFATAEQGQKADTAVQPSDISDMLTKTEANTTYAKTSSLATVATTGSYNDLTDKPTIPEQYVLPKIVTLLRITKTGLNETITTGTQKDLLTLATLDNTADNVILTANVESSDFALTSGALKLPNYASKGYGSEYCDYSINVRLTGTIAGSVNTAREFSLELQRADNTLIERKAVIKINDTTLGSRGTVFETYTLGADDPFIANGLRLILNNTSGQQITLTGFSVMIKCVTF